MVSSRPRATLICVGSELLRGKLNTHASTFGRRLASIGIALHREHTVEDLLRDLTDQIRISLLEDAIVIVTGGLGPTFDDLTREAAAYATGRALRYDATIFNGIIRKFKSAKFRMPTANKRQAYVLDGAEVIANERGTAPGQWLELADHRVLILLPGPPTELEPMLENVVLPRLRKFFPDRPRAEAHLHMVGVPESVVDERVRPVIDKENPEDVDFTILAHLGLVDLDVFVRQQTVAGAKKKLERLTRRIEERMGKAFYGRDASYPLEKVVMDRFVTKGMTLAVAESCTGGFLAKRLTDIAGSSRYFLGGVVTYSNAAKITLLDVPKNLIKRYGAVSAPVAAAMACGVREKFESAWGVSTTGVAGPDGGTIAKPVGLVYIGIATPQGTKTMEYRWRGTRDSIRQRAIISILDFLRQA